MDAQFDIRILLLIQERRRPGARRSCVGALHKRIRKAKTPILSGLHNGMESAVLAARGRKVRNLRTSRLSPLDLAQFSAVLNSATGSQLDRAIKLPCRTLPLTAWTITTQGHREMAAFLCVPAVDAKPGNFRRLLSNGPCCKAGESAKLRKWFASKRKIGLLFRRRQRRHVG